MFQPVHVVILGCGRVGSTLARSLTRRGHSVAVIDQLAAAFDRLGDDFAGQTVTGVGFDRDTLVEAGIEQADAFAAVSSGDNSNILSARVARETFGVEHVVARIYDPRRAEVYERLGIPTVATVRWTADQIMRRLLPEGTTPEWTDQSGRIILAEVPDRRQLDRASGRPARGSGRGARRLHHPLRRGHAARARHRPAARRHRSSAAGACAAERRRAGDRRRTGGCVVTDPGDSAVCLSSRERTRPAKRVAIAGAGNVGRSIALELLEHGHDVLLIEREPRALKRKTVDGALWVHGDACEVATLEEARLQEYDVVVAATGDDKVNLVVSLLAKTEFGVRRVVARVNHPKNEWLYNESWGVDVAVSTPRMLTALVEEAVSVGDLVRLMSFMQGEASLVEVTLADDSPLVGMRIDEVTLPPDTALVTILRDGRVVLPAPEATLEAGDEVLAVATTPEVEAELAQVLGSGDGGAIAGSSRAVTGESAAGDIPGSGGIL